MLRVIIFVVVLMCSSALPAQTYKILMLNTPTITIGGAERRVNDTFDAKAKVEWSSPRQAMKVLDMAKASQRLIVAEQFSKSKVQTIKEYITKNNHLSTRDGRLDNPIALGRHLTDTFYLADSINVRTEMPTDSKRFFYISFIYGGEEINKRVDCSDGAFSITRDIFSIDGKAIPPFDTYLSVYYLDTAAEKLTLITDKMRVELIPEQLLPEPTH